MKTQLNSKVSVLALAVATIWAGSAAADTLTPTTTPAGSAIAPTIPQTALTYVVLNNAAGNVGTFTYNSATNRWTGPDSSWSTAIDPVTLDPIPGTLVKNAGTSTQQTVVFSTPPDDPTLTASGPATTAAVGAAFNGTETTASSALGAGATISSSNVTVTAPGTQPVSAAPDPINYTYLNAQNGALDVASTTAYSGAGTVTSTGAETASGSVTVTSATPAYQTGNYTVSFNGASTTGTLTGGSVDLSGSGLFFNALSGTGTINTTTGVVSTSITSTPTTAITSAGITTNSMTVNGATVTTTLTTTGNATVGGDLYMTNGQIHNLAAGTSAGDAVNLGQLQSELDSVYDDLNKANKRINKGIASVAAMANIPEVDESKTFSLGLGLGSYDGDGAIAIGGSYRLAPSTVLKGSIATGSSGGKTAYGLGLSTSW